jgi:hypothetical protein
MRRSTDSKRQIAEGIFVGQSNVFLQGIHTHQTSDEPASRTALWQHTDSSRLPPLGTMTSHLHDELLTSPPIQVETKYGKLTRGRATNGAAIFLGMYSSAGSRPHILRSIKRFPMPCLLHGFRIQSRCLRISVTPRRNIPES